MDSPRTTACIVPRERFSAAVPSLEALLDDPDAPQRIAYFDGGSPPKVRDELARLARAHDITLVRSEAFVVPNVARNHLFPRVDTEFTAFLDNDVFVSRGWLPRLEELATEKGAAVVAPMYGAAVDDLAGTKVHLAGADNHFTGEPGHRVHHMGFHHEHRDPREVRAELEPAPTEQAEFHLYFARTDALAACFPLDERLTSLQEHLDVSLRIMQNGGQIWLEPAVLATHLMSRHYTLDDRRYFLLRWSRRWNRWSLERFCEEWGVDPAGPEVMGLEEWSSDKRADAYHPYRSPTQWLRRRLDKGHGLPLPDHTIAPLVTWYEDRRRVRADPPRVVHVASWDREKAASLSTS